MQTNNNNLLTNLNFTGHIMVDPSSLIQTLTGLVIFEFSNHEFCIDIKDVTAIINPNEIEDFSSKYDAENRTLQINGGKIKMIKMGNFVGFDFDELTKDSRIVLTEADSEKFGFIVDRITEIITVDAEFKTEALRFVPSEQNEFLAGSLKYEGRSLNYPDYQKIIMNLRG